MTRSYNGGGMYPESAKNCIHALSDAFGYIRTGAARGPDATSMAVNFMSQVGAINFAATANPANMTFLLEQLN